MNRRASVPWFVTLVLLLAGGRVVSPDLLHAQRAKAAATVPGAEAIDEAGLRNHLAFMASDALEGRLTPSRGLDIAAGYIAAHLARLGLRPAGDPGSYLQRIDLTRRKLDLENTNLAAGSRSLAYGDDFLPVERPGTAEGAVVYIGNGTVIKARGLDPFRNIDVAGKIVVSNIGLPAGFSQADLKGRRGDDWEMTEEAAQRRGAVAVLFLPDFSTLERWPVSRDARRTRTTLTVDAFREAGPTLPAATLTARGVSAIFAGQQLPPQEAFQRGLRREAAEPFALSPGTVVRLSVAMADEHLTTSNVVAILEGSDPVLKDEYVAIGAHYDHLGTAATPNAAGDAIYNGADDDGSGTVGMLAMAEAFAAAKVRPKRSILFVWHTGEEQGLWGSRYFTQRPTVPMDRVVAQLNIDMIGRSRPAGTSAASSPLALTDTDTVYVVGSRRLSTQLGGILDDVNTRSGGLHLDYSLDDPGDPAQIYERSDHYEYAKRGVPIAFFFTGVHGDYHGLEDEIEGIDFTKMRRIVRMIYTAARTIADRPDRPRLDGIRPAADATR